MKQSPDDGRGFEVGACIRAQRAGRDRTTVSGRWSQVRRGPATLVLAVLALLTLGAAFADSPVALLDAGLGGGVGSWVATVPGAAGMQYLTAWDDPGYVPTVAAGGCTCADVTEAEMRDLRRELVAIAMARRFTAVGATVE